MLRALGTVVAALVAVGLAPAPAQGSPGGTGAAGAIPEPVARLAGPAAEQQRIVTTAEGWTVAAWTRTTGTTHRVQVAVRTPAGAWRPTSTLSRWRDDASRQVAGHPQLVLTSRGRVMAVWVSPRLRLLQSVWRPGGGWGAREPVTRDRRPMINPLAVSNDAGRVAITWQRKVGEAVVLMVSVRRDGAWLTRRLDEMNQDGWDRNPADVVVDREGNVVVAWYHGTNGDADSYVSRLDAGSAEWDEPVLLGWVSEPFHDCICQPVLTEAPDGTTYVSDRIWGAATDSGAADRTWSRGADDAEWERDDRVPVFDALSSAVAVGDRLVVGDPTDGGRLVHERLPDGTWATAEIGVRPDHVVRTGAGTVVAVELPDYTEDHGSIRMQARTATGEWGPVRTVLDLGGRVSNRTRVVHDSVVRPYGWDRDVAPGVGDTVAVVLGTARPTGTWRMPERFDVRVLSLSAR